MSSSHFSVATAIEKNRIASDIAFILLLDIKVLDLTGAYVETLRLCRNSENIVYNDFPYIASNFSVKLNLDSASEPKLEITGEDPSGVLRDRMEYYGGGVGFPVTMTVVNTGNLDQPPEVQENFKITAATQNGYQVTFTMGIDNPVSDRFPQRLQYKDQCTYLYKGPRCKYTGTLPTCDFSRKGANGCEAHQNVANFGGFPGIQNYNI